MVVIGGAVDCRSCGEANRVAARFCSSCGEALVPTCEECDAELRVGAKFCDQCGTRVATTTQDSAPDAVRKTVTVLFADLVGSTAFAEQVDAESARREMARYHELARSVIERNGGTIAKFIGDGVMAVFGIPEIAEDDAQRAVTAGSELQSEFRTVGARVEERFGATVRLRVGINTGEVVIAEADDDLVGDAINTAARIEAECVPGEVTVGEETWRLTRSVIDYESLGQVSVRGKEDPVATYRALARSDEVEQEAPFVGREDELDRLIAAFDAAVGDGSARLVTVIGSPGVGKSRLAAELGDRLAGRARTTELRVEREGTGTFDPIADLLKSAVELADGLAPEEVTGRLSRFVGIGSDEHDRLVPLLAAFVGAAPTRSTEESFWSTRRLVEILARDEPVVLIVDDVQWAEPLFLDLMEHLVDWVGRPVLLVALARPEIRDIRPSLSEPSRRITDVLALEGLDAGATEALAARLLGTDRLPLGLADRLPDSTDGNPLFVRELMRMLIDDEVITRSNGGWELAIDSEAIEVPPTIQSLLATRVERMPADEREVMEMASVVGTEFPTGALRALLPDLGPDELAGALERLRHREMVEPTGTYWGDESVLRFHHALIRDAAYRRLLKQRRAELHLQIAEWMEAANDRLPGRHDISIAYHWEQTHEYLTQLGDSSESTAEIGHQAAARLRAAAEHALSQDDLAAAASLSERALARLSGESADRAELLLTACEALLSSGAVKAGRERVDDLAEMAGDDDRLRAWADAFEGHWVVLTRPDQLASTEPVVAAAADRLAEIDDPSGVAKARLVRALILARLGRAGECEAELDRALTAARAADDRRRITAVLGAAPLVAVWGPSPVARAGGRCLDIIRLLRITSASPMVEATSIRCQGVLEAMRGRFEQARALIDRARELVENLGIRHGVLETAMFAGLVELMAGNTDEAEPHLREAYAGLGVLGVGADAGQAAALLARALLAQGRLDEADAMAGDSDALAGQNLQTAIASRSARAEIAAAQNRHGEALALAEEAVALASPTDLTFDHANALAALAAVQVRAGDHDGAGRSMAEAADLYRAKGADVGGAPGPSAAVDAMRRPSGPAPDPTNRAGEVGWSFWSALFDQHDLDEALEILADDVVVDDRRGMAQVTLGKADVALFFEAIVGSRADITWEYRMLATRGDGLCLSSCTASSPDSTFGNTIVGVFQLDDDDRIRWCTVYEPESMGTAAEELDRRWLEHDPALPADTIATIRAFTSAAGSAEEDTVRSLQAADFQLTDHRGISFPSLDAAAFRKNASEIVTQVGGHDVVVREYHRIEPGRVVATTERLARPDDGADLSWTVQSVVELDDGRLRSVDVFDESDLDAALALFDGRAGTAPALSLDNAATRYGRLQWEILFERQDLDAYLVTLRDDVEIEDHRSVVGWIGRESIEQWFENAIRGHSFVWFQEVIAIRDDHLALISTTARAAESEFATRFLELVELDGEGLVRRYHVFDPEAVEEATALMNESYAEMTIAERAADRMRDAWNSRDFDDMTAMVDPAFTIESHRSLGIPTLDSEAWVATLRDISEVDETVQSTYEMIATRGEHLGLTEVSWAGESDFVQEILILFECDADARMVRAVSYDVEQLPDAIERLDAWYVDSLAGRERSLYVVSARFQSLCWQARFSDALDLLAPGFVSIDHRPGSFEELDREGQIDRVRSLHDVAPGFEMVTTRIHRLGESSMVARVRVSGSESAGEWDYAVVLVADGRGITRLEYFEIEDLDTALSRSDDLSGAVPGTLAEQSMARTIATFNDRDYDAMSACLDPDFSIDTRRPLGIPRLDRDEFVDTVREANELTDGVTWKLATVATREEQMLLSNLSWSGDDGFVTRILIAVECDHDGRVLRCLSFDVDQLDEAIEALDEWYRDSLQPPMAQAYEQMSNFNQAYVSGDLDRLRSMLGNGFVSRDHRLGSFEELDADGLVERVRSLHEVATGIVMSITHVHRLTRSQRLSTCRVTSAEGNAWDLTLIEGTDEQGKMTMLDFYDAEDIDTAAARFDDLTADRSTPTGAATVAEVTAEDFVRAFNQRDYGLLLRMFHPDFTSEPRRSLGSPPMNAEHLVATLRDIHRLDERAVMSRETIATRGETFLLQTNRWGGASDFSQEILTVTSSDEDGRFVRLVTFDIDRLRDAHDLLEEWYIETLPSDAALAASSALRFRRAASDGDLDAAAAMLSDDFVCIDHRLASFEELDKAGTMKRLESLHAVVPGFELVSTTLHRVTGRGYVVRIRVTGLDSTSEWDYAAVCLLTGGTHTRHEYFDYADVDVALARFDELTGG